MTNRSILVILSVLAGTAAAIAGAALGQVAVNPPIANASTTTSPPSPSQVPQTMARNTGSTVEQPAIQPELARLFLSFDTNANEGLDLNEAQAFYEWVEDNIQYRFDDENATGGTADVPVGDGRPGPDFPQSPAETVAEGFGDCEDQNGLELAFYTFWGVPAYLAFVNAESADQYDHALTIVLGGTSKAEFVAAAGQLPYYEMNGWPGIQDGYYLLVDNTYSDTFGQITGDVKEGRFGIFETKSYETFFGVTAVSAPPESAR